MHTQLYIFQCSNFLFFAIGFSRYHHFSMALGSAKHDTIQDMIRFC